MLVHYCLVSYWCLAMTKSILQMFYLLLSSLMQSTSYRTFGVMTPFFLVLKMLGMFRVDALEEEVGLDISHHKGSAYNIVGADQSKVDEFNEKRDTKHGKVDTA